MFSWNGPNTYVLDRLTQLDVRARADGDPWWRVAPIDLFWMNRSVPPCLFWRAAAWAPIDVPTVSLWQGQRYKLSIRPSTAGGDHEILLAVVQIRHRVAVGHRR